MNMQPAHRPTSIDAAQRNDVETGPSRPYSPLDAHFRADYADVVRVIDRSKVAEDLEFLTVTRTENGKILGRPRKLTMRAFLILAVLTCLRDRSPALTKITETANELPDDLLEELGLKNPDGPRPKITVSQIGHVFNLIANRLD